MRPELRDIPAYAEAEWADSRGKEVKNDSGFWNLVPPAPKRQADVTMCFPFCPGDLRSPQWHCDKSRIRFPFERIPSRGHFWSALLCVRAAQHKHDRDRAQAEGVSEPEQTHKQTQRGWAWNAEFSCCHLIIGHVIPPFRLSYGLELFLIFWEKSIVSHMTFTTIAIW